MSKLVLISIIVLTAACGGLSSDRQKPSKFNIVKNLQKVDLNKCLSLDPKMRGKGMIKVRIVAISSGKVVIAKVKNEPYRETILADCLENEVLRQRFSTFKDPRITFTFPYKNW